MSLAHRQRVTAHAFQDPMTAPLEAPYFVDCCLGHCVQKQGHKGTEAQEEEEFQDFPLPVFPQDVFQRLQGVHKPEERGIGSAVGGKRIEEMSG